MMRSLLLLALPLFLVACAGDPAPDVTTTVTTPDGTVVEAAEGSEAHQVAPPTAVAEAFADMHPSATDVEWTMEEGGYEASFTDEGAEMSVVYLADGTVQAVETEMAVADLPPAVTAALARDHAGQPVTEAARIVRDGETTFEAEVTMDGAAHDVIYRQDGTLVETQVADHE